MKATSDEADRVPGLDPVASERWLGRRHVASPWLHEEVGGRMAERLQWFREPPASWLHWEPVAGGLQTHRRLRALWPDAPCHVWARRMTEAQTATAEPAPRSWNPLRRPRDGVPPAAGADTRVGMLWANMGLHLEARPQTLIRRWHAHIQTGGFLMFSCLGPDSLRELRAVYAQQGWPLPAHAFTDMHDWGDMLVHAGFAEPVMDMERITLTFATPERLVQELRELGCNLHPDRFPSLRGRRWREKLYQVLSDRLADPQQGGQLALTFEIIYGHAFKPAPRVRVSSSSAVSLQDMRTMLRQGGKEN